MNNFPFVWKDSPDKSNSRVEAVKHNTDSMAFDVGYYTRFGGDSQMREKAFHRVYSE